jgi:hypothetical protein
MIHRMNLLTFASLSLICLVNDPGDLKYRSEAAANVVVTIHGYEWRPSKKNSASCRTTIQLWA